MWLTDYALAREQAAAGNKTILMNFTGSDWCGWCIRLRGEVFELPEFLEYAEKNLVLLELDFPRGKSLSPELISVLARVRTPIAGSSSNKPSKSAR